MSDLDYKAISEETEALISMSLPKYDSESRFRRLTGLPAHHYCFGDYYVSSDAIVTGFSTLCP